MTFGRIGAGEHETASGANQILCTSEKLAFFFQTTSLQFIDIYEIPLQKFRFVRNHPALNP